MSKSALVLGGSGFIGSHLCEFLLAKDYSVVAVDNLITGQRENIAHINNEKFRFVEHDITNMLPFQEKFDEIYNLASPASPDDFEKLSVEILMTASVGHKNILEYAKELGGRVLFASTSEVYGDPEVHPQPETYFGNVNSVGPRACYDEAKRFGEALTMAYFRNKHVDTRLVRIFNTYGPRMRTDDGRIIPNFFSQGIRNEALTIYGDGTQTRSFCYVDDLVKGIYAVMQSDHEMPFNIGAQEERTVLEMAKVIKDLTGNDKEFVFKSLPENDPKRRRPDTMKVETLLDWKPTISLEKGLELSLNYFKETVR